MLLICLGLESEYMYWKKQWVKDGAPASLKLLQLVQGEIDDPGHLGELRQYIEEHEKTVVLYHCHSECGYLPQWLKQLPERAVRIAVDSQALLLHCHNVFGEELETVNQYLLYGGEENVRNAGRFLRKTWFGEEIDGAVLPPIAMDFDGIIEEKSDRVYAGLTEYLEQETEKYGCYVGMLVHRHYWIRNDLDSFWLLKKTLEGMGIGVICVFSNGNSHCKSFDEIREAYFSLKGELKISGLVMAQMLPIVPKEGQSIAEQSVAEYKKLGIPVFHPVQSYYLSQEEWEEKAQPMTEELSNGFIIPEMSGMTEPVLISARDKESNRTVVIPKQVEWLAGRIRKWMSLRQKPNAEKKVVLMLHNAVCSGVEATIGKAYGMDSLESAVKLLRCLLEEGYRVEDIPEDGQELLERIREKKAYSDFRWTAVEDIVDSGGALYQMPMEEYASYFDELPPKLQAYMEETWGHYPGEGMVFDGRLVVTGLRFGNILVMVQPKRGCYGAKCTGEVCKILHDPLCPPTHQYLASYRYVERVFQADACIDLGTEGSLEFLPGKAQALSENCWPRIVLDDLPLIYLYHPGVPGEGTIAKRRGHAVTVTYLPAALCGLNQKEKQLLKKAEEYRKAAELANGQEELHKRELKAMISESLAARSIMAHAADFEQGIRELMDAGAMTERSARGSRLHIFTVNPDGEEKENYANEAKEYTKEELYELLARTGEAERRGVLDALNGAYIPASESGMPDENGKAILPVGRNLYGGKEKDFPGKIPYRRGMELACQLLTSYEEDESGYPEKVALNMISLDITRTGGEQLSEFFYLLGVRPIWDEKERVKGLEVISLAELNRPRIDVTVRISGVLRDTWPLAVKLMDEAVLLVSSLPETVEENYIIKHIQEYQNQYGTALEREKTIRIFGDPPGGYGAGVDLALKASAWKDEKDLAKYFINASAFAYGKELDGEKKVREFADNMKTVKVVSDVVQSKRDDLLACGFSLGVRGGMALASKYLGGSQVRHYQAASEKDKPVRTEPLSRALEKNIRETLLNPFWRETEKRNGYDGASGMMAHVRHVFEAQCLMECVEDTVLDELADAYVNDEEMRSWLLKQNPYAAEEIARRLLELEQRGKWNPKEQVLACLKQNYLEIEGDMEDGLESRGDIQAGTIEILNHEEIEGWGERLKEVEEWLG